MTTIKGVVQRVFERPYGNKTLHSFTVKGQDGFYGTGTRKAVEAGKSYEFEFEVDAKGFKNVNLSTLRPWESGPEIQAAPASSFRSSYQRGARSNDGGKDDYWKNKEARDIQNDKLRELGATRNTAISLVSLMLSNGAIKLPTKENAKEAAIYSLFEHYTQELLKGRDQTSSSTGVSGNVQEEAAPLADTSTGEPDESWK